MEEADPLMVAVDRIQLKKRLKKVDFTQKSLKLI